MERIRNFLQGLKAVLIRDIKTYLWYKGWFISMFIWPIIFPFTFVFMGKGLAGPSNEGISNFAKLAIAVDCGSFIIPGNLVWMFLNVLRTLPIYLLIYSFAPDGVSQGLYSYTGTDKFFSYYLIGMIGGLFITQIFWGMGFSLKRLMDIGVLETFWSYSMDHIHFIVGESFYNLIETIYSEVASVLIIRYIFGFYLPKEFWQAFYIFIPFTIVMYGFGIFFAAFILQIKNPNTLVDLSSFVVMSLSGTQNPPQVFPRFLLAISLIMPTTYFIDYLRVISLKMKPLLPINLEICIMSISLLILPLTGIIYFRFADKKCRKIGNIGVH